MRKLNVFLATVFLMVAVCSTPCLANGSDSVWHERMEQLKAKYGDKFSEINNMKMYFQGSTPHEKLGPSCRVLDMSSAQKKSEFSKLVKQLRVEATGTAKASTGQMIKSPWYFWSYKKLAEAYKNGMKSHLPEGVVSLYSELKLACKQFDYIKNQKNNESTMFILPAEGILGLKVPTGDYANKVNKTYLFVIPEDAVESLHQY